MLVFHLRLFSKNSFFVQLLLTSTLSVLVLQVLVARTGDAPTELVWLRAGLVGTWTVCTVAAGMIGFQRFQGTLVHLVMTGRPTSATLFPVVGSAATFGLLAFPVAAVGAAVLGVPPAGVSWGRLLIGALVFWVACLAMTCVVAPLFVLTPDAIIYEGLLAVPLVLLSGVFGTPGGLPTALVTLTRLLPTTDAVQVVLGSAGSPSDDGYLVAAAASLLVSALWFAAAGWLLRRAARRATVGATLEVV